jgi:two-component system, NarL family, sensor kinase
MVWRWSGRGGRSVGRLRLPGGAVFDRPVNLSRLMARYVLTGLIALVIIAVFTAWASRSLGTKAAIESANRRATLTGHAAIEPMLDNGILTGNPQSMQRVDHIVRSQVLRGTLIRVKIWDTDGTILYSDEDRLIGRKFTLQEDDLQAIRTGETEAGLSDLSEPENQYEEPATELLEVYLPVSTREGHKLLFEAYFRYSGITEAGRQLWLQFAPFSLGALVLLELLQVPLVLSLARRLRRTQYQREDLLRNALEATQEERRRIAGDLHDGVVQDLAGVAYELQAAADRLPSDNGHDPDLGAALRRGAGVCRGSMRALRSLLVDLYPSERREQGLDAAVEALARPLRERGVDVAVYMELDGALPATTGELVYRAVQEALRNVDRHAAARTASVALRGNDDGVTLVVEDDGRGMTGDNLREQHAAGHMGLALLADGVAARGGSLSIESEPGTGTRVRVSLPRD